MSRSIEDEVKYALQAVLTRKNRNGLPFAIEFKEDAPALWVDAAKAAIEAVRKWDRANAR